MIPSFQGSSAGGNPVKSAGRARAYMEALREVDTLDRAAPSVTSIVWDVCISENDRMRDVELGLLRSGLNALSRVPSPAPRTKAWEVTCRAGMQRCPAAGRQGCEVV